MSRKYKPMYERNEYSRAHHGRSRPHTPACNRALEGSLILELRPVYHGEARVTCTCESCGHGIKKSISSTEFSSGPSGAKSLTLFTSQP
eukprot:149212-Amorphochlora_amoeboformis.AAC.2